MALNAQHTWRVRVAGNELNGGGFDASISGAGTDYSDQDAAQATFNGTTVVATTSGISTTIAITGYTVATSDKGNTLRIASGANFAAGYYRIDSVNTSLNTWTLDRNCTSGVGAAMVGRMGGAHADLRNMSNGGGLPSPIIASPLLTDQPIFIRGSGSNNPTSADYDFSGGYWTFPTSRNALIGYNGRPFISSSGIIALNWFDIVVMNLVTKNVSGFYADGLFTIGRTYIYNCVFDLNGHDAYATRGSLHACEIKNTGSTAAGSNSALLAQSGTSITQCHIHDVRGDGILGIDLSSYTVADCLIHNCGGNGITANDADGQEGRSTFINNTIADNVGHGFSTGAGPQSIIFMRNLVTGHSGSGKYGFNYTGSYPITPGFTKAIATDNDFYGNTADANFALDASNTTLNPSYVGSGDYTPTNTALLVPYTVGQP